MKFIINITKSDIFLTMLMSLMGVLMFANGRNNDFLSWIVSGLGIMLIVQAWALFVLGELRKLTSSASESESEISKDQQSTP